MFELSLMSLLLSDLNWDKISLLSTIQTLYCKILYDFMQRIPSPWQRVLGTIICFIICLILLLLEQAGSKPGCTWLCTKIQTNSYLAVSRLCSKLVFLQTRISLWGLKRQDPWSWVILRFQVTSPSYISPFLYCTTKGIYCVSQYHQLCAQSCLCV